MRRGGRRIDSRGETSKNQAEVAPSPHLERVAGVGHLLLLVNLDCLADAHDHLVAVVLELPQVLLDRGVDGLVNLLAHVLDGVGDAGIGPVLSGQVELRDEEASRCIVSSRCVRETRGGLVPRGFYSREMRGATSANGLKA